MKRARRIPLVEPALRRFTRPAITSPQWRPPTLAWHKLSRPRARPVNAHRAIVGNLWSPHFSLHLKVAFIAPARAKRLSISTNFESALLRRNWLTHQTALRQIIQWSRGSDRMQLDRIVRDVTARERLLVTLMRSEVRTLFRTRTMPLRAAHIAGRPPRSTPDARRARSFLLAHAISVRRSHVMFLTGRHVVNVTTSESADLALAPRLVKAAEVASRPPELVWRTETQPFTLDAIERRIGAATALAAPFSGPGPSHIEQISGPHASVAAGRLDPALLDRVAEDVIGRVERRIRIERERRGV